MQKSCIILKIVLDMVKCIAHLMQLAQTKLVHMTLGNRLTVVIFLKWQDCSVAVILNWTIMDYHNMDYHGLSWTIMKYHKIS